MKLPGWKLIVLTAAALYLSSCGGATQTSMSATPLSFAIGGTISGLAGTGLVLQDNATNNLTVTAGATSFLFTTPIPSGSIYAVTVLTQPSNPAQSCSVTSANGTATSSVANVEVNCSTTATPTYTVGGTITGVSLTGLTLQNNGADNLSINANQTSFTFAAPVASGTLYSVTILTQPSAETCSVTNGSGTADANVTNVQVLCAAVIADANEWTWEGNYGEGLSEALSWTDPSGNFWFFGGQYSNNSGYYVDLNSLGEYSNGQWVALNPSTLTPVPRTGAAGWTDASGHLWMFGGFYSVDHGNNGPQDFLGDFWEYSAGQWTQPSESAAYPLARYSGVTWTDASGNFWLFGGITYSFAALNDLWEYSAGQWTQIGAYNSFNQAGIYGTLGTASSNNVPGSRSAAVTWIDASGAFWLFGGSGYDSTGAAGPLNDLWRYSAGEWTWISGSNLANQAGTYGTQGKAAPGNIPGARSGAVSWIDSSGSLWLFGGNASDGGFNDLWKYSSGQWTWVSGASTPDQPPVYGTQGQPAPGNVPGARSSAVSWIDKAGNLWLFGGNNFGSLAPVLGDLWMYQP